ADAGVQFRGVRAGAFPEPTQLAHDGLIDSGHYAPSGVAPFWHVPPRLSFSRATGTPQPPLQIRYRARPWTAGRFLRIDHGIFVPPAVTSRMPDAHSGRMSTEDRYSHAENGKLRFSSAADRYGYAERLPPRMPGPQCMTSS